MKDKYLPLGTVCTIKNMNEKIMIIGFLSREFDGAIKIYDYQGCIYPKGTLNSNGIIAFNHVDIEKIEYLGYIDNSHTQLNKELGSQSNDKTQNNYEETANHSDKPRFEFDENGVIIADNSDNSKVENPFVVESSEKFQQQQKSNNNLQRFEFDENGIIIADNSAILDMQNKNEESKYVFDENGYIIADNTTIEAI